MSSLTKFQEKTKTMFDKAVDELTLMIKNKIKSLDLIHSLMVLKIIIKEIDNNIKKAKRHRNRKN